MKSLYFFLIMSMLLFSFSFSQNSTSDDATSTENKTSMKEKILKDTAATIEKTEDSEMPANPFLSGEDKQAASSETPENPFVSEEEPISEAEPAEEEKEEERRVVDILVDLGLGVSLSRFFIEPKDITTEGKPSFLFNPGVIFPFAKRFFAGIAIRYMQLSVDLSYSSSSIDGSYAKINAKTSTNEIMTFLSAPIKLGMRFETQKVNPYFYMAIEPAYLMGSNQFVSKEIRVIYPDGSEYLMPGEQNTSDINTIDYRTRQQIFIGGGIGIEISYGYGFVYLDGCCQYALFETDNSEEIGHSTPWRSSSRVIFFPVSLGIRFFL